MRTVVLVSGAVCVCDHRTGGGVALVENCRYRLHLSSGVGVAAASVDGERDLARERHAVDLVRHGEHHGRHQVVEKRRGDAHVLLRCLGVLVGEPALDRKPEREKRPDGHSLARGCGADGAFREERVYQVPCDALADLNAVRLDDSRQDLFARIDAVSVGHELCTVAVFGNTFTLATLPNPDNPVNLVKKDSPPFYTFLHVLHGQNPTRTSA